MPILKCPYYGLWKVHIVVLGVPNNRLTCMQGQKTFIFLRYAFVLTFFVQQLPNDSLNDSFFQTPPLRDANLYWLVWFHLKQCLWSFNAPKAAPSGKEWICIFIQTNAKIKLFQVCAGNMLMFHVDVNMKRLGIHFKMTRFNDSESTLSFERQ